MKKHIPNFITTLNLLSGCIAITLAFAGYNYLVEAACFIMLAAVFDFLDGFVARLLHSYSLIGKELDSLADLVSFGIAPSVIAFQLLSLSLGKQNSTMMGFVYEYTGTGIVNSYSTYTLLDIVISFSAFLIAIFSALRLAKFNIDTRQTESFIGLPTPANALLFASFPLMLVFNHNSVTTHLLHNTGVLLGIVVVQSFLLVSEIPLFSLKFKSLRWRENKTRLLFIISSIALLSVFLFMAVPLIIVLYVALSVADNILCKKHIEE